MIQYSDYQVPRPDLAVLVDEYRVAGMNMIARKVLPKYPVPQESAKGIPVLKRENLNIEKTKHANGSTFERVDMHIGELEYACEDHGLEGAVTKTDYKKYASQFDAEAAKTKVVRRKILLAREKRVADKVFDPTTFTGNDLFTD